jgi:predicted Zn finger-like uncharacterized protein
MTMVTRCPSCGTLFRVTPQHLQACHGQVRCGRCMTVFDGFRGLATLPEQGAHEPGPRSHANGVIGAAIGVQAPASIAKEPLASALPRPTGGEPSAAPRVIAEPAPEAKPQMASTLPNPAEAARGAPSAARGPGGAGRDRDGTREEVASQVHGDGLPRRNAPGWSVGIVAMLVLLGMQALYVYRVDLVSSYPAMKPVLVRFCDLLGCGVPLPQRPERIAIEASDLQVQDPQRPGVIQLTATLRNHAAFDVGLPALDLVLTNTKEHTLARRIFMPEEYLEAGRSVSAGLAANAEITIRLLLDTGDLGAAGFRLALLPAR